MVRVGAAAQRIHHRANFLSDYHLLGILSGRGAKLTACCQAECVRVCVRVCFEDFGADACCYLLHVLIILWK